MRRLFPVTMFFVFYAVCGCTPSTSVKASPGWTVVDARKFQFSVPPDIKAVPVRGIDSFVGQYKGTNLSFDFDYGEYSNPLDGCVGPEHVERIDGKEAKIVEGCNSGSSPFGYAIGVHFPHVIGNEIKLTVFATCKTTNDYETAKTIFRTIRFK